MASIGFILINILLLFFTFLFDKGFQSFFVVSRVFPLTIFFLLILLNLNTNNISTAVFFVFGILVDWNNKSFLGLSSLLSLSIFYIFKVMRARFAGNKFTVLALNFVCAYLLFFIFYGYDRNASLEGIIFSAFSTLIIGSFWAFKSI